MEGEQGLTWALPQGLEVPPDKLRFRIDIYSEAVLLHQFGEAEARVRQVSAGDIARAFTSEMRLGSGILPEGALWWRVGPEGAEVALWRRPQVWRAALQLEAFRPPRRFTLPMPGLVFVCSPGRAPRVYAARSRPGPGDTVYHAPLFNVFRDGRTCPGSHRFPESVDEIPESFFTSFFTVEADTRGRSQSHPDDLLALWEELDGRRRYPMNDLVPLGTVEQVMEMMR